MSVSIHTGVTSGLLSGPGLFQPKFHPLNNFVAEYFHVQIKLAATNPFQEKILLNSPITVFQLNMTEIPAKTFDI